MTDRRRPPVHVNFDGIEVITFDVGGTLLFPHSSVGAIYSEVLAVHGVRVPAAGIDEAFLRVWKATAARPRKRVNEQADRDWWQNVVHHTLAEFEAPPDFDLFFDDLWETFMHPPRWRLAHKAFATLEALTNRGYHLALLSNWDSRLRPLLEGIGLTPYFGAGIFISCEIGMEKPDPRLFSWVEEALKKDPWKILHLGDSLVHDVEGARKAGWRTVHFELGLQDQKGNPTEAEVRISCLSELLDYLPGKPGGR